MYVFKRVMESSGIFMNYAIAATPPPFPPVLDLWKSSGILLNYALSATWIYGKVQEYY
jgi:hypothetical protein